MVPWQAMIPGDHSRNLLLPDLDLVSERVRDAERLSSTPLNGGVATPARLFVTTS